jgi:uncharacterized protein
VIHGGVVDVLVAPPTTTNSPQPFFDSQGPPYALETFAWESDTHGMTAARRRLRAMAVSRSLRPPTSLARAVEQLGFVQADPIRAPARAQDLILRHRARGYRAGDLERRYASLGLDEDILYAYGFLPRSVARLLHPRKARRLTALERRVLAVVRKSGRAHPAELEAQLGGGRVVNAWGGISKATTTALERLHHGGYLRVADRQRGVRLYEAATPVAPKPPRRRLEALVLTVARILAPSLETTLRAIAARLRRHIPRAPDHAVVLRELIHAGALERERIDGLTYVWPAAGAEPEPSGPQVKFLAPFDPLVWDRRRFEHLWGWSYRFEAYTPPAKRVRGYYAMPLLWGERVIGWANASLASGGLHVELGFAERRPRDRLFRSELDAEIARLEAFLAPDG